MSTRSWCLSPETAIRRGLDLQDAARFGKETGLSRHEQNKCLEELKKKNVLDRRLDYRINRDALDEIMEADLPSEIRKPDFAKSGKRIDFRELLIAIHHL
jgi:hypothetical protein